MKYKKVNRYLVIALFVSTIHATASVCPSVCLSVTLVICVRKAERIELSLFSEEKPLSVYPTLCYTVACVSPNVRQLSLVTLIQTTDVDNSVRPSQVVDDAERPTLLRALDLAVADRDDNYDNFTDSRYEISRIRSQLKNIFKWYGASRGFSARADNLVILGCSFIFYYFYQVCGYCFVSSRPVNTISIGRM